MFVKFCRALIQEKVFFNQISGFIVFFGGKGHDKPIQTIVAVLYRGFAELSPGGFVPAIIAVYLEMAGQSAFAKNPCLRPAFFQHEQARFYKLESSVKQRAMKLPAEPKLIFAPL